MVTAANGRGVTHTGLLGPQRSSYTNVGSAEEDEANARLIAVSPCMFATLVKVARAFTEDDQSLFVDPDFHDEVFALIGRVAGDEQNRISHQKGEGR